jgi:hypothetical protein
MSRHLVFAKDEGQKASNSGFRNGDDPRRIGQRFRGHRSKKRLTKETLAGSGALEWESFVLGQIVKISQIQRYVRTLRAQPKITNQSLCRRANLS